LQNKTRVFLHKIKYSIASTFNDCHYTAKYTLMNTVTYAILAWDYSTLKGKYHVAQ